MKIVAVIPIKLNNERLPGKNTKLLGGYPLIVYIQNTLLQVDSLKDIFVYCSDDSISSYLQDGISFLRRDKKLDLQSSNFNQIFDAFMSTIDADIYVYAHATAPFVTAKSIDDCIEKVRDEDFDSAFTATKIQDYLWCDGEALNFDAENLPRSQDLVPIYRETSGVYVFTKAQYLLTHRRIGKKPYIKEVSYIESIDINTYEDFELAQLILNK
ncbi:MAG: acylneuraminate cytidylyltransferase [Culturomica sp.]|jgi:CMP-N-acetylneuraminic acid synthetase|nr:acylneuraminate cytidylyltransferase [Culturomica sp.]